MSKVRTTLAWIWGVIVLLGGVACFTESPALAVSVIVVGVLCLPPVAHQLKERWRIPKWIVYVVSLVAMALLGSTLPSETGSPVAPVGEASSENASTPEPNVAQTPVTGPAKEPSTEVDPAPATQAEPVEAPAPKAPSFSEIRRKMKGMTSVQWDRYQETLKGTAVDWTGWVDEVRETLLGKYEVWIDMDPPSEMISVYDVSFHVSEETALRFCVDDKIRFDGRIKRVSNVLGSCSVDVSEVRKITILR
jgi:hypothetical protein